MADWSGGQFTMTAKTKMGEVTLRVVVRRTTEDDGSLAHITPYCFSAYRVDAAGKVGKFTYANLANQPASMWQVGEPSRENLIAFATQCVTGAASLRYDYTA